MEAYHTQAAWAAWLTVVVVLLAVVVWLLATWPLVVGPILAFLLLSRFVEIRRVRR